MNENKRKIVIEFPKANINVSAVMQDNEEPKICQVLWKTLEQPIRMICHHTLSTGDYFQACGRPPRHPVSIGSQATPIGRQRCLLCRLKPGSIIYAGGHEIAVVYGRTITEPLMARGPIVAQIPAENLGDIWNVGRIIWNAQYITHELVIITLRREEA